MISKAQYKRSEKGEFHHIAHRTVEETKSFISNFPWKTERSLASVELTCPSVTLEHPGGTYLKIGPYFGEKYSLYYLAPNKKVYFQNVDTMEEVSQWVKVYFENEGKLTGFKKYSFTLNPLSHFKTNRFEYLVNRKATMNFFRGTRNILLMALVLFWIRFIGNPNIPAILTVTTIVLSFFLIYSCPLIYFYFNYFSSDRNSYLQISKGHEEFIYGTRDNKKRYNKQDIASIDTYVTSAYRSPWRECELFIITFKDGERIRFTSLLISSSTFRKKFPNNPIKVNSKYFPTVESIE
ncbi:hypothetical protein B0I27_107162 [Arcticibacter pallidicorallinus]|uniref:PH domain-containing protein n=1 Tax=Arcticibacter pallidicorallinus TaxID=1259464 RepID=A0A2T0U0Z3_9SPHI|nr:hypothetical protein B0I27_107162 [Arcticibacter pallidicorallinus]